MRGKLLVASLIACLILTFQLSSTTATEVPSVRFSSLSALDSTDCQNGRCELPKKVAAVVTIPVLAVEKVLESKPVLTVVKRRPVVSALRRIFHR